MLPSSNYAILRDYLHLDTFQIFPERSIWKQTIVNNEQRNRDNQNDIKGVKMKTTYYLHPCNIGYHTHGHFYIHQDTMPLAVKLVPSCQNN